MNRIIPISGVDVSAAPTIFYPVIATPLGHLVVDVANVTFSGTVGTVDQGIPNSLTNGWPVKITDGTNVLGTSSNPIQIGDAGGSITVDGTLAVTQSGTWILGSNSGIDIGDVTVNNAAGIAAVNIQDGGNSITIDNGTLSIIGGGLEATALRVTIASDSTGLLSVDDNGASLTVDNSTLSVIGGGTEATALRVTIANDSTGLLSVDDNGSSLTTDNPVGSQADGHSLTIGATTDLDTADTVVGRLKAVYNKITGVSGANAPATNYLVDRLADGTGFIASGTGHPAAGDRALVVRNIPRKSPTATITVTPGSTSNVTVLPANSARLKAIIVNDSNRIMYIKFSATASLTDWTRKLTTDESYEVPIEYTGIIDAIWPTGVVGDARVTEIA